MATKISELTSGSAAGTDQIPVNQAGTTKRVTALAVSKLAIDDAITNGVTDRAPAQNVVFDQLALKADAAFTPTTAGNWSPAPTTIQGALDQLAARVKALEP